MARVEALLSRFDAASEISRINRTAALAPVTVDREVWDILADCRRWWEETDGAFDIAAGSRAALDGQPLTFADVELDDDRRSVFFTSVGVRLDLGGYGKGYALDCAGRLLADYGVDSACLHAGGSSVVAVGTPPEENGWRIGVRDPLSDDREVAQVLLCDRGLSTSAVLRPSDSTSDILEPHSGQPLERAASCSVIASSGALAEVFSTAFLVMGESDAWHAFTTGRFPVDDLIWCAPQETGLRIQIGAPSRRA